MIVRLLLILLIFVLLYLLFRNIVNLVSADICTDCEGKGYWKDTRGDRNTCKICGGTGQID